MHVCGGASPQKAGPGSGGRFRLWVGVEALEVAPGHAMLDALAGSPGRDELDVVGAGLGGGEGEQPGALLGQGGAIVRG